MVRIYFLKAVFLNRIRCIDGKLIRLSSTAWSKPGSGQCRECPAFTYSDRSAFLWKNQRHQKWAQVTLDFTVTGCATTLVSLDPIHASFSISERERIELGMDRIEGDGSSDSAGVEVQIIARMAKRSNFIKLDFLGSRINLNTGTIAIRAIADNRQHCCRANTFELTCAAIDRRSYYSSPRGSNRSRRWFVGFGWRRECACRWT